MRHGARGSHPAVWLACHNRLGALEDVLQRPAGGAEILDHIMSHEGVWQTTADEIAGCAEAMREHVLPVRPERDDLVDTAGTGGDGAHTINISTAAAIVAAAAGAGVAKHGNRAVSSASGSADVLDALGVRIDHDAASAGESLRANGFAFLFAPSFHPAMKNAGPTRKEIGVRTAFNLLGPLTNPAGTSRQLLGMGDATAAPRIAEVAQRLGTARTFVIHGAGIDELPLDDSGVLYHVAPDAIERHDIPASKLGLRVTPTARLAGGTPEQALRFHRAEYEKWGKVVRDAKIKIDN